MSKEPNVLRQKKYGAEFYEGLAETSARSAAVVVPIVLELLGRVSSVLDIGCGTGEWLAVFKRHGVADILGIDHDVPTDELSISHDSYRTVDLGEPFTLGRTFDLVLCLEVAEHLPEASSHPLVTSLGGHGDAILFSAAIPFQGGVNHINEQWLPYWQDLFISEGFTLFDIVRPRCWLDSRVALWYRQNMVVFARGQPALTLAHSAASAGVLDVVHPALWEARIAELAGRPEPGLRAAVGEVPRAASRALRRRLRRT